jgi:hypothetical protein
MCAQSYRAGPSGTARCEIAFGWTAPEHSASIRVLAKSGLRLDHAYSHTQKAVLTLSRAQYTAAALQPVQALRVEMMVDNQTDALSTATAVHCTRHTPIG